MVRTTMSFGVVVLITFSLLELALRLIGYSYYWALSRSPDSLLGYRPFAEVSAWQRQEGEARITTDARGWRRPALTSPADGLRLLILGDSMTEAVQVPVDQTYWAQLPERMAAACPDAPGVTVRIAASSGYGPGQYLAMAENDWLGMQPDWVIYTHFPGNDLAETHPRLTQDRQRPFPILTGAGVVTDKRFRDSEDFIRQQRWSHRAWRWLLRHSRSLQAAVAMHHVRVLNHETASAKAFMLEPQVDGRAFMPPVDQTWREAWERLLTTIRAVDAKARKDDLRFTLVSLSTGLQITIKDELRQRQMRKADLPHLFFQENVLRGFSADLGIDFLALAPAMAEIANRRQQELHGFSNAIPGLGHWNRRGHHAAASLIAAHLCARLDQSTSERTTGASAAANAR